MPPSEYLKGETCVCAYPIVGSDCHKVTIKAMTTILGNSTGCVPRSGEMGGVCSGRGICVDVLVGSVVRPTCLCEAGWSPIGDLATDPSVDCGINVAAQRALWGIATISQVLLLGLSVTRLYQKRKKMKWSRVDTKVFTFGFIQGLCMSIICIMQAINSVPGATSIGIDPVTTSLFAIGCSAFMIMVCSSIICLGCNKYSLTISKFTDWHT